MLFEIIFLFFGSLLIVVPAARILKKMRLKRDGILVSATVVDIHRERRAGKNKSRTYYHPVFEYPVDGRTVKNRGPGELDARYSVGTVFTIRYDPQNPQRILVGESVATGSIAPIIIGIAFIAGSVLSMSGVKLPEFKASAGYYVFAGMLLIFAVITISIVKSMRQAKNKLSQRIQSGHMANNVLVAAKKDNSTIVFQFVNGNQIDYVVPESDYDELQTGDWGNLTFQGSQYIRFERTHR